jgi:hypothetical protein
VRKVVEHPDRRPRYGIMHAGAYRSPFGLSRPRFLLDRCVARRAELCRLGLWRAVLRLPDVEQRGGVGFRAGPAGGDHLDARSIAKTWRAVFGLWLVLAWWFTLKPSKYPRVATRCGARAMG